MLARLARTTALAFLVLLAPACRTGGSFLVFGGSSTPQEDLVARARAAQEEAREARTDFSAAALVYQRLTAPQAIQLEDLNDEFDDSVDACADRAEDLLDRIESIRRETESLVKDWTEELGRFSNDSVRKKSEAQMRDTEAYAQRLLAALERLQGKMQPVLLKLQDYQLFFEHNLNARAIATLQDTYKDFDNEVKSLESEFGKAEGEISTFLAHFAAPEQARTATPPAPAPAPSAQAKTTK